ncbi:uncharacterized protein LOC134234792, partial [Saccostrea cucullata]|uniref:uncharacterized protein LOC134234792 n=1 Tax=Saccostrea cuccullata TaxID=36930 RepID=UPI002ED1603D
MDTSRSSQIKIAIERISESVFWGLCCKVGTSKLVVMRRDVMDIGDIVGNQVIGKESSVMVSGSQREGFRLKGSDVDYMSWPNNHRVIWELSQSQYYNTHRQTLILCDCSESPLGFTLLCLLSPSMYIAIERACVRMYNRDYISSFKLRQLICSVSIRTSTEHGPCANRTIGKTEIDNALCFVSDFWPPYAFSWINRCHSWPQPHVVDDIVKH